MAFEVEKQRNGIYELVERLNLQTRSNTMKCAGIGGGAYNDNHKILRQKWYQVTNKMLSSDNLRELVDFSARQVVEDLDRLRFDSFPEMLENVFVCKIRFNPFIKKNEILTRGNRPENHLYGWYLERWHLFYAKREARL